MASQRKSNPRPSPHPQHIVSACLAGINCTYRGRNKRDRTVEKMVRQGRAVLVCPEVMGGLTTPRINGEITGGDGADVLTGRARVTALSGNDLTPQYLRGSYTILELAQRLGIRKAILKSKSPACGCGAIYDGTFRRILTPGNGVLTALLLKHHFTVLTENDL